MHWILLAVVVILGILEIGTWVHARWIDLPSPDTARVFSQQDCHARSSAGMLIDIHITGITMLVLVTMLVNCSPLLNL